MIEGGNVWIKYKHKIISDYSFKFYTSAESEKIHFAKYLKTA